MAKDYKAEYELLMVKVIDKHPFFSNLLSNFRVETREDAPYAAGVWVKNQMAHMYINPELFFAYSSDVQVGVIQHEIWHVILGHQNREYSRNHDMFNVAADLSINKNMVPQNCLPEGGCFYDVKPFKLPAKLAVEEYYKLILDDQNLQKQLGVGSGKDTIKITIDDHGVWTVEGDDEGINSDLAKEWVKKAVERCGGIGNVPGEVAHIVSEMIQPSKLDWRRILQMFVNRNVKGKREQTWMRYSKRLPGLIKGKKKALIPKLGVLIDSSGSISDEELNAFNFEVHHVHKRGIPVRVVVFDMVVHNDYEYNGKFQEIKGRGGTDVRPALTLVEKDPTISAVVVLTDMETPFPDSTKYAKQTLWISVGRNDIVPPFGKVIKMQL